VATIKDVAREAGVSISTVSHTLSGKRPISPATRQRVLEAIKRLDYRPNLNARGLASQHTGVLGLVVADISNPFYPIVARGVEDVAHARDYSLMICSTDGDERRESGYIDLLESRQVDGIIYMAGLPSNRRLEQLLATGRIPVVAADERLPSLDLPGIYLENTRAGALVADHFIGLGHRDLAFVGGPAHLPTVSDRLAGYRGAIEQAGLSLPDRLVTYADNRPEGGLQAATLLLEQPSPPTAILAANDMMAIGILEYCRAAGIEVPMGVSVVGVDDLPIARLAGLTSIHQPMYAMGTGAARMLLEILDTGRRMDPILIVPELVVRRSSGPLGGAIAPSSRAFVRDRMSQSSSPDSHRAR
jgi:LacI family transcriptional regulator, galactose operon repressor